MDVVLTLLPQLPSAAVTVEQVGSLPASDAAGVIEGVVTDGAGAPIAGVTLTGLSSSIAVETGPDGTFRITRVRPGLHVIRARKLGRLPEYIPLRVPAAWRVRLAVRLRPVSDLPQLAGVTIREDARMVGFFERRKRGNGIFVTREDFEQPYVYEVTDVLRGKRTVELRRTGPGGDLMIVGRPTNRGGNALRSTCPPGILIDGVPIPWADISLDRLLSVNNLRALEVYTAGRDVPLGFQRAETDCGAVLAWTR